MFGQIAILGMLGLSVCAIAAAQATKKVEANSRAVLNGLTARDALCMLVGCMLAVLDEAPSDVERQQSLVTASIC
jgi:hypothetical protein